MLHGTNSAQNEANQQRGSRLDSREDREEN